MTNFEMCQKYLRHIGCNYDKGQTLDPILPILILDLMYQELNSCIKKIDCKFEMKQARNKWIKAYNRVNRRFFNAYTPDEQDEVLLKFDDFDQYIHNDLMFVKIPIMDYYEKVCGMDFETAKKCSSCSLACILAMQAKALREEVLKYESKDMNDIVFWADRFVNLYYLSVTDYRQIIIDDKINNAIKALSRRICSWLLAS